MALKKLSLAQMKQLMAASKAVKKRPGSPVKVPYRGPQPSGGPYKTIIIKPGPVAQVAKVVAAKKPSYKLSPCPFCKSTKVTLEEGVTYPYVRCEDCCAHGPYVYYSLATTFALTKSGSREQLVCVDLWNTAKR